MRQHPTEQELRDAYAHHRTRRPAGWPETFEEAMADPTLCRLLRITAMHPPRAQRRPASALVVKRETTFNTKPPRGYFDCKRAAAGERDDD